MILIMKVVGTIVCTIFIFTNCYSHEYLKADLDRFYCKNKSDNSIYIERCTVVLNVVPDKSIKYDSLICFGQIVYSERNTARNDGSVFNYTNGFVDSSSWPPNIIEGTNYLQIGESVYFPPHVNVISAKPLWFQCQIKEIEG